MRAIVEGQGIKHVVHFTRVSNLPGVFQYGLLGRQTLVSEGFRSDINDQYRFDCLPNAVCCSLSFPNYKMFYRLRVSNPGVDWAVIRLSPSLLWEKRCVFCISNAATREISAEGVETRMTSNAFQAMFSDHPNMPDRSTLGIPNNYTTNPQAEVLVLDPIESRYMLDVLVDDKIRVNDFDTLAQLIRPYRERIKFYHAKKYFDARADYAHWRTE